MAAKDIDEYIAGFPPKVQKLLKQLRRTIRKAAPEAEEKISYQMPAYAFHGALVYFAGYEHHIGLYPVPRASAEFREELAAYEGGKGTARFPLDEPLPLDLITRIVQYRVKENLERAAAKKQRKKRPGASAS